MLGLIRKIFSKSKGSHEQEPYMIRAWSEAEMATVCKILFVDNKKFPIIDGIKNSGWPKVEYLRDVDSIDNASLVESHLIFLDIQGVGKILKLEDEGLGLAKLIKNKYPEKIVILYSSEEEGRVDAFSDAWEIVDDKLRKNSDTYSFLTKIQKHAPSIFTADECYARVGRLLKRETGQTFDIAKIETLFNHYKQNRSLLPSDIERLLNIKNAYYLVRIVESFFKIQGAS